MIRFLFALALIAAVQAQEPPPAPAPVPAVPAAPSTPAPSSTVAAPTEPPPLALEIDLATQKAWVLQDGQRVYETSISSGRAGHETPSGNFTVLEKDPDHKSSLYGRIVDGSGRVLVSDADCDTPVPSGGKFVQAPMEHFLRFDGPIGMHAGRLPGYPASHGCIRLPPSRAALFFNIVEIGTPVRIFGKAPRTGPPARPRSTPAATPAPSPTPKGWFPWIRRL